MKNMAFPLCVHLPDNHLICQVVDVIESEYEAGLVVHVEQLYGGYTNLSFAVSLYRAGRIQKIFFRKYWKGVTADVIEFEHALLGHVIERGAGFVAGVIHTLDGRGYVERVEVVEGAKQAFFYAAFDFIEGFDKYSWINNKLNFSEFRSAGAMLAGLHCASSDFAAPGLPLPRVPLIQVIPRLSAVFEACSGRAGSSCLCSYYLHHLPEILDEVGRVEAFLTRMPHMPSIGIHGDYHPGNQKYYGDRVVGVFDFDRANIDLRAFDVALAVIYFCCTWGGAEDGHIRLDTLLVFLEGYQGTAGAQRALGPLNALELASLPMLLAAANLVLIKWATADTFYAAGSTCNSAEYLSYLQHQVQLMYWLQRNRSALSRSLQQLADGLE